MDKSTLQGFFEEIEKLAVDTATMTEALGVPGSMYSGLKNHGAKGLIGTGLGAGVGTGLGFGVGVGTGVGFWFKFIVSLGTEFCPDEFCASVGLFCVPLRWLTT